MDWLREIRKAHGMTGTEVAQAVGISQPSYSYIESGTKKPSVCTAKKIAAVLDFDWTRFYGEPDPMGQRVT